MFSERLQEMKFHGVDMAGPARELRATGAGGRWKNNIHRDMLRKVCRVVPRQYKGKITSQYLGQCVAGQMQQFESLNKVPVDMVEVPLKSERGSNSTVYKSLGQYKLFWSYLNKYIYIHKYLSFSVYSVFIIHIYIYIYTHIYIYTYMI